MCVEIRKGLEKKVIYGLIAGKWARGWFRTMYTKGLRTHAINYKRNIPFMR